MKHLFVPYEIALALKEKGFDEPCLCYWYTTKGINPQLSERDIHFNGYKNYPDSNTIAPLYQQVIDWLELKHNLRITRYPEAHDWWELWEVLDMGYHKRLECSSLNTAIEEALKLI